MKHSSVGAVHNSSFLYTVIIKTLIRKMATHSRYFLNPYQMTKETIEEADIQEGLKKVNNNIRITAERICRNVPPQKASDDSGLYVGVTGIAYAFFRLSQQSFLLADEAKEYFSLAQQYLQESLYSAQCRDAQGDCSFMLGDGGTIIVGAAMAAATGDYKQSNDLVKLYLKAGERYKSATVSKFGSDEFFVGRAGYLYGALWLNNQLNQPVIPVETMHEIAYAIIQSGKHYATQRRTQSPLMYSYYNTEYLGAAHGLSSILHILIKVPNFLDVNPEANASVRGSVDYLLSLQSSTGNFPCALDEVDANGRSIRKEEDELVHWCHGAPGVIYVMAAAFIRWKDQRYLDSCIQAGELVWHKGLLKKGPGICHGVAGNGYVFLLLYRLTGNRLYLQRAVKFAEFLGHPKFIREALTPSEPYSLYEGLAGTLCYLADLMDPDKASFPFQDVF